MIDQKIADALPTPDCPDGLGLQCPGPFEVVSSQCRPGETDATVRCRECGSAAHHVLDAEGKLIDVARRDRELARSREAANAKADEAPRETEHAETERSE